MQRWLFFVVLHFGMVLLSAQSIDVQKTSVSFWFTDSMATDSLLHAEAKLRFKANGKVEKLLLYPNFLEIKDVRKVEGRLKESYPFQQRNDSLWITGLDLAKGETAELHFAYHVPLYQPMYQSFFVKNDQFLSFNYFNTEINTSGGLAGSFYPALPGDASRLEINLTFDENYNSSVPGQLDFSLKNPEAGTISHFWSSVAEFSPEQFYLVVGNFEESDPTELRDELPQVELDTEKLLARQVKDKLVPLLNYFDGDPQLSEEDWTLISETAKEKLPGFYLQASDVNQPASHFKLEKAFLLKIHENDTGRASEQLLNYYVHRSDEDWLNQLLARKWEDFNSHPPDQKRTTLAMKFEHWRGQTPWLSEFDKNTIDTAFKVPLLENLELPQVAVQYRYVASDTAQYVLYSQDTPMTAAYHIPVKITLVTRRDSNFFFSLAQRPRGPAKTSLSGSPPIRGSGLWSALSG